MHDFFSILSLFTPLFDFEPNLKIGQSQRAKKKFNFEKLEIEELLTSFSDFPVFSLALAIVYESLESINELSNPSHPSTKEMQRFKSNIAYLDRYISSFQDTAQLYRNIDQSEQVEELEEIIRIFEHVKDKKTRDEAIQWLIQEFLTQNFFGGIRYEDIFPNFPREIAVTLSNNIQNKMSRRTNIYLNYFDGFDISIEDIYRSMTIKLYYLYAKHATNKGRGEANPNTHLERIVGALRNKKVKISPKKMNSIYIKGFFSQIAIFDYKKTSEQVDAIDGFYKQMHNSLLTQFSPQFPELLIDQRKKLIDELILF